MKLKNILVVAIVCGVLLGSAFAVDIPDGDGDRDQEATSSVLPESNVTGEEITGGTSIAQASSARPITIAATYNTVMPKIGVMKPLGEINHATVTNNRGPRGGFSNRLDNAFSGHRFNGSNFEDSNINITSLPPIGEGKIRAGRQDLPAIARNGNIPLIGNVATDIPSIPPRNSFKHHVNQTHVGHSSQDNITAIYSTISTQYDAVAPTGEGDSIRGITYNPVINNINSGSSQVNTLQRSGIGIQINEPKLVLPAMPMPGAKPN